MNLILIGQKSSGKTTIGKNLAKKLNLDFIDTDTLIEKFFLHEYKVSKNCNEIYKILNFKKFRDLESKIIENISCKNTVISTGGGIIESLENLENLENLGSIIYLKTDFKTLLERIIINKNYPANISENDFEKKFKTIFQNRDFLFNSFSSKISINTKNKIIEDIIDEILNKAINY